MVWQWREAFKKLLVLNNFIELNWCDKIKHGAYVGIDNCMQEAVTASSTCGGVTEDTLVHSQNLTPIQSTISATIDSQSSICGNRNTLFFFLLTIIVITPFELITLNTLFSMHTKFSSPTQNFDSVNTIRGNKTESN